jgi:hypothetical protein
MEKFDLWKTAREAAQLTGGLLILRGDDEQPTVKMWRKKAIKPYANYRFKNITQRELYIRRQLDAEAQRQQVKTERKAARTPTQEQIDSVKVGDIFVYSWGYDQTNVDFYEIIEKRGRVVMIRELAQRIIEGSEGFMSDKRAAVPKNYTGDPVKKVLGFSNGTPYLPQKYGWCDLWDGRPQYCSWYA